MRTLGGFDDRYYLNWEDVDLSLRVRLAGKKIGLVTAARIYHKVSRSLATTAGKSTYYYVRNNLLIVSLYGATARRRAIVIVVAGRIREALRAVKHRNRDANVQLLMTLRAFRDYALRRYGPLRKS